MGRRGVDEIAVVEAMYDLSGSQDDWLKQVSRQVIGNLGAELGSLTIEYQRLADGTHVARPVFVDAPPGVERAFPTVVAPVLQQDSEILAMMVRSPFTGFLETFPPDHPYRIACAPHLERVQATDTNAFAAFDTRAHLVTISPLYTRDATPTRVTRERYRSLAAHLSAAMRLRRRLQRRSPAADAVFAPGGKDHDATGAARDRDALEELRVAVRARESARSRLRRDDPDRALSIWTALVSGRWSLVDRFESDGRRFVLALCNENQPLDPRALTPREEQIAQLAGQGVPNCEIAYAVGVTAECVSAHLSAALRKLKCSSRGDLIRIMKGGSYEYTIDVDGDLIGVIAEPPASDPSRDSLTEAEREIFIAVQAGRSNAEIAEARGTSARTVANQVASILRKTGAGSRYELMRL